MDPVIAIHHVTKDYGQGRGVFDLSLQVEQGEVLGFLGPNGAGKTTAIRQLMGFIRPDKGSLSVFGRDCFSHAAEIRPRVGYLPGEAAFMDDMTGAGFIRFVSRMKGLRDFTRARQLEERFELDPSGKIRKMSKGTKQKVGIVCAFMQDPDLLILDEPTSGLDPLMQKQFIQLLREEKARGKTILLSSHLFEEVESTCDRVAMIKDGRLITTGAIEELEASRKKRYTLLFPDPPTAAAFASAWAQTGNSDTCLDEALGRVTVFLEGMADPLIKAASRFPVCGIESGAHTLEEWFLQYYGRDDG